MSGLLTMPFCVEGVAKSKNTLTEKIKSRATKKLRPNNETSSMKVDGTQEVNWGISGTWEHDIVQEVL